MPYSFYIIDKMRGREKMDEEKPCEKNCVDKKKKIISVHSPNGKPLIRVKLK